MMQTKIASPVKRLSNWRHPLKMAIASVAARIEANRADLETSLPMSCVLAMRQALIVAKNMEHAQLSENSLKLAAKRFSRLVDAAMTKTAHDTYDGMVPEFAAWVLDPEIRYENKKKMLERVTTLGSDRENVELKTLHYYSMSEAEKGGKTSSGISPAYMAERVIIALYDRSGAQSAQEIFDGFMRSWPYASGDQKKECARLLAALGFLVKTKTDAQQQMMPPAAGPDVQVQDKMLPEGNKDTPNKEELLKTLLDALQEALNNQQQSPGAPDMNTGGPSTLPQSAQPANPMQQNPQGDDMSQGAPQSQPVRPGEPRLSSVKKKVAAASAYEQLLAALDMEAQHAHKRLEHVQPVPRLSSKIRRVAMDQQQLRDLAIVGAAQLARNGLTSEQFFDFLTSKYGPAIEPYAEQIYQMARKEFGKRIPNFEAHQTARNYAKQYGLQEPQPHNYATVDPARQKQMAQHFDQAKSMPDDPAVRASYVQLGKEIDQQYAMLPIKIIPWDKPGQPYQNSREMMQDVMDNRQMYVFKGGNPHSILTDDQNFKLRAVHDYFGHAMNGYEFGPRGEENAWIEHSKLFSPLARKALTTETRGQNSWVNAGPHSHLPVEQRPYAEQKAFLMPDEFVTHDVLGGK